MGKFNKTGKREMPALNTSSLPDLIFTLLFFFMIVTTMREVTLKVQFTLPDPHGLLPVRHLQRRGHADGRRGLYHRRGAGLGGNGPELCR